MADLDFTAALDLGNADRDLQRFAGQVDDTGRAMETSASHGDGFFGGIVGGAAKLGLAVTGVGALVGVAGDLGGKLLAAGKAAGQEQQEIDQLTNTLTNAVPAWDGNTA